MQAIQVPPEIAGYIAELQEQLRLLSDRAASRTAELHAARARIGLIEGRIRNLEASGQAKRKNPEKGKGRAEGRTPSGPTFTTRRSRLAAQALAQRETPAMNRFPTGLLAAFLAVFLWRSFLIPVAASLLLASWAPASAAACMARESLVGYLAERFAEQPRAVGLILDRRVMELFVSARGTWSIVLTDPRGIACLVMAGDGWDQVPAAPAPEF